MNAADHRSLRTVLAASGGVLAAGAVAHALPALAGAWPPLRGPLGVQDRTASGLGYALTFDDGPHPRGTPAVLEGLRDAGVSATFFLVGEQVMRYPSLAAEVLAAGHEVALHCHRHRNLLRLTPWQLRDDLDRAADAIGQATNVAPVLYRPPYGILSAAALAQARRRHWRTLLWSHWGRDWEARATPRSIAALLTRGADAGSVLLLHDADHYARAGSWRRTAAALPDVIQTLSERGLHPVAL
jgi:peptidoglycan/xylan/chitin deacetylase (PgdA/CDA1 family)